LQNAECSLRSLELASIMVIGADCVGAFNIIVDPVASDITFSLEAGESAGPFHARTIAPEKTLRAGPVAHFFNVPVGQLVNIAAHGSGMRIAGGPVRLQSGAITSVFFNAPAVWQ
jgi:hypothetical protein